MNARELKRIISAKDYGGSARKYLMSMQKRIRRNSRMSGFAIRGMENPTGQSVYARIESGRWIADCECGGASFIDPIDPLFFCFSCGNYSNGGMCRPVIVPVDWQEIEAVLLERPVVDVTGMTDLERVSMARPVLSVTVDVVTTDEDGQPKIEKRELWLTRSWVPGETVADLHAQQDEAIRLWKEQNPDGIQSGSHSSGR